jgi:hypothetical protein
MENLYYQNLVEELKLRGNKLAEKYFNVLWEIYMDDVDGFKNKISIFRNGFSKAYNLYLNNDIVYFTNNQMHDDKLNAMLKTTEWDNITRVENFSMKIIDPKNILSFDKKNEGEIYIIDNLHFLTKSIITFKQKFYE